MDAVIGIGLTIFLVGMYVYIGIYMYRWYKNFPKE